MNAGRSGGFTLGITGTIGSGKSSVSRYLAAAYAVELLDADAVCRSLTAPGGAGYQLLAEELPPSFFLADGALDRRSLRRAIFGDPDLRSRVNALLHPLARQHVREQVRLSGSSHVVVEAALLYEAGWRGDFDAVLLVYAEPEQICRRLAKRDGFTLAEARSALSAQWPLAQKVELADHVVDNSGPWAETCLQLVHLGDRLGLSRQV